MFGFLENPLATNQTSYMSIDPSGLYFILKIHLHPIGLAPLCKSMKVHVLFFLIESISILMACSERFASKELIASEKLKGLSSTRYV